MTAHLHAGDCADLIDYFAECDVQISDLPYRPHVHQAATSQSAAGGTRLRDLGFGPLTSTLLDIAAYAASKVKRWSLIYSDVESTGNVREACEARGAQYIRLIPWVRWSMPNLTGTMPPQGWEALTCVHSKDGKAKRAKAWNGAGNLLCLGHDATEPCEQEAPDLAGLRHLCLRGEDKHKTEKPLDQALDLVSWFSNPGETVLDITAGRGTIGVACALLGRDFVGAELQTSEHALASERIARAQAGRLSERDLERAIRYFESTKADYDHCMTVKTFTEPAREKAARRLADAHAMAAMVNNAAT